MAPRPGPQPIQHPPQKENGQSAHLSLQELPRSRAAALPKMTQTSPLQPLLSLAPPEARGQVGPCTLQPQLPAEHSVAHDATLIPCSNKGLMRSCATGPTGW